MDGKQLRTFLIENAVFEGCDQIGRIQVNKIAEGIKAFPRIWIGRSGGESDVLQSGSLAIETINLDLEVCSLDIDEAFALAETLKTLLRGYHGAIGDSWALGVFVDDHDDQYLPKNDTDKGFHICSLSVSIIEG